MDARVATDGPAALTHRDSMIIILGVLVPVFMGSVDTTILASALPIIGREFNDVQNLPWLITAYLIAMTATTPLYGKISDIHGRRATLYIALGLQMTGSLICALAPNMFVLILGRAVQGLGGGALSSTGMIVLGDIATPRDRGKYYAYFAVIYTTSGACGPALGGFLAEHVHWSAIFWLSIPLGIIATLLAMVCLRKLPRRERYHRLDFLGAALIVAATVVFMLALNMGGVVHPWTSMPIVLSFVAAAIVGALFIARLLTAPEPLIPLAILKDPVARAAIAFNTFGWSSIIGLNIFLPMYLQRVMGLSATAAGLSLVILMVTLNASAGVGGLTMSHSVHYKRLPMIGLVITIAAVGMLAWQADRMTLPLFEVLVFALGLGFGPVAPLASVSLQNAVAAHHFGTSVGTMNFARMLFATVLIAVFGALVASSMTTSLAPRGSAEIAIEAEGFRLVFIGAALCLILALIVVARMEAKPLKTDMT